MCRKSEVAVGAIAIKCKYFLFIEPPMYFGINNVYTVEIKPTSKFWTKEKQQ